MPSRKFSNQLVCRMGGAAGFEADVGDGCVWAACVGHPTTSEVGLEGGYGDRRCVRSVSLSRYGETESPGAKRARMDKDAGCRNENCGGGESSRGLADSVHL